MRDFTLLAYKNLLLELKNKSYTFFTFADYCNHKSEEKYVVLRHDIDKSPKKALRFAELENALGIKSTYYFLAKRSVFNIYVIKKIAELGHEIGYHYRDLVDARGNIENAFTLFQSNLGKFRTVIPIKTIAMDGCPWSKYDNRKLWNDRDYQDFEIIGEPYFDFLNRGDDVLYFTDTARMWDGDKYNVRDKRINLTDTAQPCIHTTFDFINWVKNSDNRKPIMITTHPQRWTDNKIEWGIELFSQSIKNKIKYLLLQFRK